MYYRSFKHSVLESEKSTKVVFFIMKLLCSSGEIYDLFKQRSKPNIEIASDKIK